VAGTLVRKVLLQIASDDGDTEAKLDAITAKANDLKELHPELAVKIDTAAASAKMAALKSELKDVGSPVIKPDVDLDSVDDKIKELDERLKDQVDKLKEDASKVGEAVAAAGEQAEKAGEKESQARLATLGAQLAKLNDTLAKPKVSVVGAAEANAELLGVESKLDKISKDAGRAGEDAAKAGEDAAKEAGEAGEKGGESFLSNFKESASPYLIGGAIAAALAALPAIAAAGGAMAGIALGAALLIGTSSAEGPLYSQFHDMTSTLMSVVRTAALPLVQPLASAFAQIGKWAQALYPELHAVFGSLGPLVAPMTRGFEGLVSGVLPGFLRLMQSAKPAVSAVAGLMSSLGTSLGGMLGKLAPAVKASSQFLSGLSGIISALLPVVGQIANTLASMLGPAMQSLGSHDAPLLAKSILEVLQAVQPLLPGLSQISAEVLQIIPSVAQMLPSLTGLAGSFLGMASSVLPTLIGQLETLIGWLNTLASVTDKVLGLLSKIPALGILAGAGGGSPVAAQLNPVAVAGLAPYKAAVTSATTEGYGDWAADVTGDPASDSSGTASAAQAGQKLGLALGSAAAAAISGATTVAAAKTAVDALVTDVSTAFSAGLISDTKAQTLTTWLNNQLGTVDKLVTARATVAAQIAKAKAYEVSTTQSTESAYGLTSIVNSGTVPTSVTGIIQSLRADVADVRKFKDNLGKLAKMGLNKAYLQQLISMGPDQGGPIAAELATANIGQIGQVNTAKSQIATLSAAVGRQSADEMYDTGKNAGKGFLSGLESQESQINAAMQKIAKNMVKTLRTELGIASPSRVGRDIGANFGGSVGLGIEDQIEQAAQSSRRLSRAITQGAAAHASAGSTAAAPAARVVFDFRSASPEIRTFLKKSIRITGGNVQVLGL
jgi:hypothetical protein